MNYQQMVKGLSKPLKEALKPYLSPDTSNSYYKTKNPTSVYALLLLDRAREIQKGLDNE